MYEREPSEVVNTNKSEIEFIEDGHTYIVNGKGLPSVSQIMSSVAEKYYANIDRQTLQTAAQRGTNVHMAVEMYETLGADPTDETKPYLTNYKVAKKLKGFEPIENELRLTNGEFCGTLDMLANYRGQLVIIDLKCTSKINSELLEIQLAGYMELANHNGYKTNECYVLQLKKDGYKFKEVIPNYPMWEQLKADYVR